MVRHQISSNRRIRRRRNAVRASGMVTVQVVIDETGNVISADRFQRESAAPCRGGQAAQNSKFVPTLIVRVKPIKVTGVIVYNFVDTQIPAPQPLAKYALTKKLPRSKKHRLSPKKQQAEKEAKYRQMLAEKLHSGSLQYMSGFKKAIPAPLKTNPNSSVTVRPILKFGSLQKRPK